MVTKVWVELRKSQKNGEASGIQKYWELLLSLRLKNSKEEATRINTPSYCFSFLLMSCYCHPLTNFNQKPEGKDPKWDTMMYQPLKAQRKIQKDGNYIWKTKLNIQQMKTGHFAIKK